jgi:flavin reductase (DIM6/NTAB) family NADH-FMN oxidoreductase RutF
MTTVAPDGRPNAMTIGWGGFGVLWGLPVFTAFVRPSRFTFDCLAHIPEFVINVPDRGMEKVCQICGTKSGRDLDKLAECGLTAVAAEHVRPPLLAECRRFYECRVVHYGDLRDAELPAEVRTKFYARGDLHRIYYGHILRAVERVD